MPNTYLSVHEYIQRVTGQGVTLAQNANGPLIGNLMRVGTSGIAQGGTSLPVIPNTTVNLNIFDPITIFDGSSTEIVTVTATTAAGASTIPITATQFAHVAGISCCSDGSQGSLADAIIEGSSVVERVCRQPLLQATYTAETLPLLTTRAWVDSSMALGIRPMQFPVQSVSAITLIFAPVTSTLNLDVTQAQIDSIKRIVSIKTIKSISAVSGYQLTQYIGQDSEGEVQISYIAGFLYPQLPYIIKRAATLLTSDILSDRRNPTGAASIAQGKVRQDAFLRGDLTGESALFKRARFMLKPYIQTSA